MPRCLPSAQFTGPQRTSKYLRAVRRHYFTLVLLPVARCLLFCLFWCPEDRVGVLYTLDGWMVVCLVFSPDKQLLVLPCYQRILACEVSLQGSFRRPIRIQAAFLSVGFCDTSCAVDLAPSSLYPSLVAETDLQSGHLLGYPV